MFFEVFSFLIIIVIVKFSFLCGLPCKKSDMQEFTTGLYTCTTTLTRGLDTVFPLFLAAKVVSFW